MSLQSAAEELRPLLQARSPEIEQGRRLPADLAKDMAQAGFFRLLTPESLGGAQTSPAEFSMILQTLAAGDASAAWCVMVACTSTLTAAYLPHEVAQQIFADPKLIMGGVFAPMGKAAIGQGGYQLSGRWQWASGSQNCDWLCAGAMLTENEQIVRLPDGAPDQRMLLFKREHAELIDSWHVAGLKGTGSGDFKVENLPVPFSHAVSLTQDKPVAGGALYVFPVFGLLALGIASVALGNAQASLAAIRDLATSKKPAGGRRTLAERGAAQAEFAKGRAQYLAARAFLQDALHRNWEAAQIAGKLDTGQRADLRLACTHATRASADVTRIAYDLGGGASVFLNNELQRRFRDAHVATAHMMVAAPTYELTGRIAFGLDTDTSQL